MPKTTKTNPHFRFCVIDLPESWQEKINEAYKKFALEQIKQGKNPCKTDFIRHIIEHYLTNINP